MKRLRATLARQVPNLSRDVVRSDRDGICRLDTTLVSSDVHQFVSLLRDAAKLPPGEAKVALEEARHHYRGDLLSGHAARFYEWVDERGDSGVSLREHYREQYYRVTQKLARIYVEEGRAELAIPLYKDILKTEPTLEDVVRELYRCYQQLGDLSSLIREDRHLRQALREAYYDPDDPQDDPEHYHPEPETVSLFDLIREQLDASTSRA
jgi:DNA-binding SARP family transcriptional activator